jgi:hypothetical protein
LHLASPTDIRIGVLSAALAAFAGEAAWSQRPEGSGFHLCLQQDTSNFTLQFEYLNSNYAYAAGTLDQGCYTGRCKPEDAELGKLLLSCMLPYTSRHSTIQMHIFIGVCKKMRKISCVKPLQRQCVEAGCSRRATCTVHLSISNCIRLGHVQLNSSSRSLANPQHNQQHFPSIALSLT